MKIYVVTQGAYSDYGIVGVAIDRKQAEYISMVRSRYNDSCNIEEYDTEEIKVNKDFEPNWLVVFDNDKIEKLYPFTGRKPFKVKEYIDEDEKIFIKRVENLNRLCTGYGLSEWEEDSILKMYRLSKYQPLSEIAMECKGSIGLSHRKERLKKINIVPIVKKMRGEEV